MKLRGRVGVFRGKRGMAVAVGVVLLAALALSSCATARARDGGGASSNASHTSSSQTQVIDSNSPIAPAFPNGMSWLNTVAPLTLKSLRGKFVLLDFWTYGCINCIHEIPWLKKIEADFPKTLVVIGVHSAKYSHSAITKNIKEAILRYGINYPVVNDDHFAIWQEYGADAWPTAVLIDPQGRIVDRHVGEGFYPGFKKKIETLSKKFAAVGLLDKRPLKLKLESQGRPQSVLAFPGKVSIDPSHHRLFIADTGHNRIVVARPSSGNVVAVIGNGKKGLVNGSYSQAEFNQPQGMAYSPNGRFLYVADTGNSDIRVVNLVKHTVSTLVGTGKEASTYPPAPGTAPKVALNSPWALALHGKILYIAMAGSHQIWTMDLKTKRVQAFAGSGYEGALDGPDSYARLAQPSGLSLSANGKRLYFANSEGSEIRYVNLVKKDVVTLAGPIGNLFESGNRNAVGTRARFQHPLGVAAYKGTVYVADTYNSEIRAINPKTGKVTTLAGGPKSGWRDGKHPLFYEPGGITAANGKLYIADTNNNSVRVLNLKTHSTSTLVLKGLSELTGNSNVYKPQTVKLSPVSVAPGTGVVKLAVAFPSGYKVEKQAPSEIDLKTASGGVLHLVGKSKFSGPNAQFPMSFKARFKPGTTRLTINLSVVYCKDTSSGVCLIHQAKLVVPVTVKQGASSTGASSGSSGKRVLDVSYKVE